MLGGEANRPSNPLAEPHTHKRTHSSVALLFCFFPWAVLDWYAEPGRDAQKKTWPTNDVLCLIHRVGGGGGESGRGGGGRGRVRRGAGEWMGRVVANISACEPLPHSQLLI